jgi:hypothetical protein
MKHEERLARTAAAVLAAAFWIGSSSAGHAQDLPEELIAKVEDARLACAAADGVFDMGWGGVRRIDLDGNLKRDWALDEAAFVCSSIRSLYCGTGGCASHFWIDGVVTSMINRGWDAVTIGPMRVLIADVHGTVCGGIGPTPCATASMWDKDEKLWRSGTAIWE